MKKKNLVLTLLILALVVTAALIRQADKAVQENASKDKSAPAQVDVKWNEKSVDAQSTSNQGAEPVAAAQLIKIDGTGTRIYQIDGTQVSVLADGELFFLPLKI